MSKKQMVATHRRIAFTNGHSRKEAREARYWIRVICAVTTNSAEGNALEQESTELVNILSTLINKGKLSL
jgi:four helix bundle protein